MRPKFSIIALLELTAIIAIAFALDQIIPNARSIDDLLGLVIAWGALSGAYLGFRWSRKRNVVSIMSAASIAATCATLVNAARVGIMVAETARREADYFSWKEDWLGLLGYILAVTVAAAVIAPVLSLLPIPVERAWRRPKQ